MAGILNWARRWRPETPILIMVSALACSAATATSPTAEPPVTREMAVVVLPTGFRVEGVYIAESRHVLELVQAAKPKSVVIKVCKLTPEKVVAQFQSSLYELHSGGQTVQGMPRNALECAFPTERERSVKGT